jgi:hypothetical protein
MAAIQQRDFPRSVQHLLGRARIIDAGFYWAREEKNKKEK